MAVLVKIHNRGMSLNTYDEIAPRLVPELKRQPGFHMHLCNSTDDGLVVQEVWDSAEQQREWFERYVRPNIPPEGRPEIEVVELHNVEAK
jgi:hypothetical protein